MGFPISFIVLMCFSCSLYNKEFSKLSYAWVSVQSDVFSSGAVCSNLGKNVFGHSFITYN